MTTARASTTKALFLGLGLILWSSTGCGHRQSVQGDPDASEDATADDSADALTCSADSDCDDDDPCTSDSCESGSCLHSLVDADADGYPASEVDGTSCDGTDCDDTDPSIHPGADEQPCSGRDDDCDGVMSTVEDADGDGHPNAECAPDGVEPDCDDTDDSVYPGAPLQCDGLDHDCSGHPDRDEDDDGHFNAELCVDGDDCDDARADVYAGAPEVCMDGIDQDCDGIVDGPMLMGPMTIIRERQDPDCEASLLWTGSEFGLKWCTTSFSRLDANGQRIVDDIGLYSYCEVSGHSDAGLTWTGSEYYAAGQRTGGLYTCDLSLMRLGPDGSDSEEFIIELDANADLSPALAWSGSTFGILYDQRHFRVVDPEGTTLCPEQSMGFFGWENAILFTNEHFVMMSHGFDAFQTGYASPDGTYVSEPQLFVSPESGLLLSGVGASWTGTELGFAWSDNRSGTHSLYFTRANERGERISEDMQISGSTPSFDPVLAYTGSEYGVVWHEGEPYAYHIHFNRMSSGGEWLDESVQLANSKRLPTYIVLTGLAWTGSEFGLAWYSADPDGLVFDRIGFCE